ncbi:MAG: 50S ribosomal protein L11 methyltransferase [Xanthobacteraceae bacterium]|nr:50S ribosomal protein L11 methyltransferase [Xanthobacteraceae bacterium]
MTPTVTPQSNSATFSVGDERRARGIVDVLEESLEPGEVAVAAFENAGGVWEVVLHFSAPPDEAAIRHLVGLAAGDDAAAALAFRTVEARDWVRASLEGLVPVPAGRFVVHGRHDRDRIAPNKLGIEIEAALAFGTGHHGTTRGCLLLLDAAMKRRRPARVLDLGSGTGVLAIAAAKARRLPVLASDIDPQAVVVAGDNARLNGVGPLIGAVRATGFAAPAFRRNAPFDLILANILANPLRQMAPAMAAHLAPRGQVILSGLLPAHTRGVIASYRAVGLVLARRMQVDGWCSLLMRRAD